jgi:hypothetical protein
MFIETAWKNLAQLASQWEFELPQIQSTPCHTPSLVELQGISLPRFDKAKCRSLNQKERRDSVPLICEQTPTVEKSLSRNGPLCQTQNQSVNFRVTYSPKEKGRIRNSAKETIPLESFLALFSSPYGDGSLFAEMAHKTKSLAVLPSILYIARLGKEGQFSQSLAEHLIKHRDYYKTFWAAEIQGLCTAVNIPANKHIFRLQLEAGQVCSTIHAVQPVKTSTPTPSDHGGD